MVSIPKKVIDLIVNSESEINRNDFETLYEKAEEQLEPSSVGILSSVFIDSGIDPLKYLKAVPPHFLRKVQGIDQIDIPNNIEHIGQAAFWSCYDLTQMIIPESVKMISRSAFFRCPKLEFVSIKGNVSIIDTHVFGLCPSLIEVSLPEAVTEIREEAFEGCYSLAKIFYGGSMNSWNKVKIGDSNNTLNFCTIHCIDGDITKRK